MEPTIVQSDVQPKETVWEGVLFLRFAKDHARPASSLLPSHGPFTDS